MNVPQNENRSWAPVWHTVSDVNVPAWNMVDDQDHETCYFISLLIAEHFCKISQVFHHHPSSTDTHTYRKTVGEKREEQNISSVIEHVDLMVLCGFIFLSLSISYPLSLSVGCLETCSRMH